jgi:Ca2+-binding RTX toxin-like protein
MRRAAMLAAFGSVLLVAFAGVALAAVITCTGGRCEGTPEDDEINGTQVVDLIFALGGDDDVDALDGQDELNGQNGNDELFGGNQGDTYNGGQGSDYHSDFFTFNDFVTNSGRDVMNGGIDSDYMEGNTGADILRGQGDDECGGPEEVEMFGDEGNDKLYGGGGRDCMEGEEGTDEHYGGADNDFIDAVDDDRDPVTGDFPAGTHDLVDCGGGFDTAIVNRREDIVRGNCEDVFNLSVPTTVTQASSGTTDEDQQQQAEAFLVEHGLQ